MSSNSGVEVATSEWECVEQKLEGRESEDGFYRPHSGFYDEEQGNGAIDGGRCVVKKNTPAAPLPSLPPSYILEHVFFLLQ